MPMLHNVRLEACARARARGEPVENAYDASGFIPDNDRASWLNNRPEIAQRIVELRLLQKAEKVAMSQALVVALLQLARTPGVLATASGIEQARLALLDAATIREALAMDNEI